MKDNSEFDSLEELLAQPPLIADRGFSERISTRITRESRKTISQRGKIFSLAGVIWLALVVSLTSPLALFENLYGLLINLNSASSSIDYTALQSSYPIMLALALSLAAAFSLLSKN